MNKIDYVNVHGPKGSGVFVGKGVLTDDGSCVKIGDRVVNITWHETILGDYRANEPLDTYIGKAGKMGPC